MAISYPVDSNSKWSVYDLNTLSVIASNKNWPRGDGGEIQGLVPSAVYLLEVKDQRPTYDSDTHRLEKTETVDVASNTITIGWDIVALTQEEIDARIPEHFTTTGGVKLKIDEASQNAFANLLTLLNQSGTGDGDTVTVKDATGDLQQMDFATFKTEIVAYGQHCYTQFLS